MSILWRTDSLIVKLLQSAHWKTSKSITHGQLSGELRTWLFEPHSMTQRLRTVFKNKLRVNLLTQTWQQPLWHEAQKLQLNFPQLTMIREVELLCDEQIFIMARTILPANSLRGKNNAFTKLGIKPIGDLLFQDKCLQRTEFEFAKLKIPASLHPLISTVKLANESLWARRSVFHFHGQPLLITELFMLGS